jgi:hypothetical protein
MACGGAVLEAGEVMSNKSGSVGRGVLATTRSRWWHRHLHHLPPKDRNGIPLRL